MTALVDWIARNQQTLTLLGTGAATVLAGMWAVARYLLDRKDAKGSSRGGNQRNSTGRGAKIGVEQRGDSTSSHSRDHSYTQHAHPALVLIAGAILVGTVLIFFVFATPMWAERPVSLPNEAVPPPHSTKLPQMDIIPDGNLNPAQRQRRPNGMSIPQP